MVKKIIIVICLLLLTSCTTNNNSNIKKERTFLGNITDESGEMVLLLNTEVYLTTANPLYKDTLINIAKSQISKYHKLFDSHHYYLDENNERITNIKVLNDSINKGPIKVDPIIIDALKESINLMKLTNGYFNISLGKLSSLYNDKLLPYDSYNDDPSIKDIKQCTKGIIEIDSINQLIIIDEINNTVELKSKDELYEIDLGAFSKGYIINKVYDQLIGYNTSFLLTAGSSSIITYSVDKENISWNIGVIDPNNQADNMFTFNLNNGAISTSGDYENYYFLKNGTRRHHILNPYTGFSENYYHSNTLLSSNAFVIDALSTALFNVKNKEERIQIIKNIEDYYDVTISYCFIKENNDILMNNSFKEALINNSSLEKIKNIEIE